jgi:hypothetical protein
MKQKYQLNKFCALMGALALLTLIPRATFAATYNIIWNLDIVTNYCGSDYPGGTDYVTRRALIQANARWGITPGLTTNINGQNAGLHEWNNWYVINFLIMTNYYVPVSTSLYLTTHTTGTCFYVPYSNTLSITVTGATPPIAWTVAGPAEFTNASVYRSSGIGALDMATVPTGTYSVTFGAKPGYISPFTVTTNITGASPLINVLAGAYVPTTPTNFPPFTNDIVLMVDSNGLFKTPSAAKIIAANNLATNGSGGTTTSGVSSIRVTGPVNGAITFSGTGVTQSNNTFNFSGGGLPTYIYSSSPTQYISGGEAYFADYTTAQQVFIPTNVSIGQTFFIGGLHSTGWRIKPDGTNMVIVDDQSSTNYISVVGNYPSAIFVKASNFYYAINHWGTYSTALGGNLFSDGFETYTNGTPLIAGINGWYGSSSSIMVQTNTVRMGTNAAMIPVDCILSNRFSSTNTTDICIQMDLRPILFDSTNPPVVNTNVAAMFYINSNGNFVVHNGPATNPSPTNSLNWLTVANGGIGTNGTNWVTARILEKFSTKTWDLYANSTLVTNNIGFINTNLTNFAGFDIYNGASTSYLDNVSVDAAN